MPRRKAGELLPLEAEILHVALMRLAAGDAAFYGFALAHAMREEAGSRSLVAHGTLYKALARLEDFGLLASRWEDVEDRERPRRRLYQLTAAGIQAAQAAHADQRSSATRRVTPRPA